MHVYDVKVLVEIYKVQIAALLTSELILVNSLFISEESLLVVD